MDEAKAQMPKYLDFGLLNSHPLYLLNLILTKVYQPLLSYRIEKQEEEITDASETDGKKKVDRVDSEKAMRVNT